MRNPLRTAASFFVIPCDEKLEPEPNYLPSKYSDFAEGILGKRGYRALKKVVKEHRSELTGEIIGYTLESGHYIVATDAQNRHSEAILKMMP